MSRIVALIFCLAVSVVCRGQSVDTDQRVEALLKWMTLEEKVGQMNQYNGDWVATGPVTTDLKNKLDLIRQGKIGSMLNIMGVEKTRTFQEAAMQSRLKIPLIFGQDVIHGFHVTFPIPLAEAASWDMQAIERSARIAATEAAAAGIQWTFAPMVDISRDPRWGRVMEGAGEDPYLGSAIARARVRGFQGKGLGHKDAVMATAKHFAAYGAAIGGRDYNSVDLSMRTLWEVYLPPFHAALQEGVATFMNSFNDVNGTPATASKYLQRDILKGKWGFDGFVVSDWGSVGEMVKHGYSRDPEEAALHAVTAGSDMDMESSSYIENLPRLVREKKVPEEVIDDAVRRILRKKFELGLFDDPFRFNNARREKAVLDHPDHHEAARDMARKSMVLLKNEGNILPLSRNLNAIALIGPHVKSEKDMKGFWSVDIGQKNDVVSLFSGIRKQAGRTRVLYAEGCSVTDTSRAGFAAAVETALKADVVIMAMGEAFDMTGEAKSRADIGLPGVQEELIRAVVATGKPVVVLLMAGRPMVFDWTAGHVPSILYTWWPGSEAGNALADVLFGTYNPAGKLPMTFPRSEGQIPVYYNHLSTGRPASGEHDVFYRSAYVDLPNSPRFPFGHGLSYTTFRYSDLQLSTTGMSRGDTISVSFELQNTGKYAGEEVVQLYLQDVVARPVRPVKELKDFKKISLQPGERRRVTFTINKDKLAFYDDALDLIVQDGEFRLMIGSSSADIRLNASFHLKN